MPLSEIMAWDLHFAKHPPLHILLGQLLAHIAMSLRGDTELKASDFLPWLREKIKTLQEESDALLSASLKKKK